MSPPRVVVVGGGVSGLTAAWSLATGNPPAEVLVLEAGPRAGGALSTRLEDGLLMEEGADSFIRTKPAAIDLCERLGLGGDLIPTRPSGEARTLIVREGRLVPVPEGVFLFVPSSLPALARSPLFSLAGKIRMGLDLVLPRGGPGEDGDESIGAFARRRLGREALERLVEPMVAGIWGGDPDETSLRSTLPRLAEMERAHRSLILAHWKARSRTGAPGGRAAGARYGLFVTLRRGMQALPDALASALPAGAVRTGCRAVAIERRAGGWRVVTAGGERFDAGAVILAVPAAAAERLLRPVDTGLADRLEAIPCLSAATVNLAFPAAGFPGVPEGYGFLCPAVERRSLLACTFSSRKYEGRSAADRVLVRAYVGGPRGQDLIAAGDEALTEAVLRDLTALLGLTASPTVRHVRRYLEVFPVYRPGHAERVAQLRSRAAGIPGLALAGNALDGVGVSDCVEAAVAAADGVRRYVSAASA